MLSDTLEPLAIRSHIAVLLPRVCALPVCCIRPAIIYVRGSFARIEGSLALSQVTDAVEPRDGSVSCGCVRKSITGVVLQTGLVILWTSISVKSTLVAKLGASSTCILLTAGAVNDKNKL